MTPEEMRARMIVDRFPEGMPDSYYIYEIGRLERFRDQMLEYTDDLVARVLRRNRVLIGAAVVVSGLSIWVTWLLLNGAACLPASS